MVATFTANVSSIGQTLLVLEWEDPKPLKRAWCLLEITASLKQKRSKAALEIIMAPEEEAAFERALVHQFDTLVQHTCAVNVAQAEASKAEDKQRIFQALEETLGFQEVNKQVIERMRDWMAEAGRAALGRLGREERRISCLLSQLARLLLDQGKLNEAEIFCQASMAARRSALGDEHPDTLISINNMALLLKAKEKSLEAEPLFREVLAARRRTLGVEHPDTLDSIGHMALLLQKQGKLAESKLLCLEAVAVKRRKLGDEHPDTLDSFVIMALVLQDLGNLDEAESLQRQALAVRRRTLGNEHPSTLTSVNNMACLLQTQGKLGEAETLCREALSARQRTLGDNHPDTLTSTYGLACCLQAMSHLAEADILFQTHAHASFKLQLFSFGEEREYAYMGDYELVREPYT